MGASLEDLAERLASAYRSGPIPPLRDGLQATDAAGAYAIQSLNTRRWVADGRRIVGRKIGLTAKAVQAQLGVDQPDFGILFDDMAIADGGILPRSRVLQPKAEAEVAFTLRHGIDDPDATIDDVRSAVREVCAAIEIVDSRIADWRITFADTVADNGSSAFFVLGRQKHAIGGLDLYSCGMVLEVDGAVASTGTGAACLGHPLEAARWLARTAARLGDPLRTGDVILTGALGPMVALVPGNEVRAVIGGVGECSFSFGEDKP